MDTEDKLKLRGFKKYRCHKEVWARPMNRADYNAYRMWDLPANENGTDEGYLIMYEDGYISWSPKKQLDNGYTLIKYKCSYCRGRGYLIAPDDVADKCNYCKGTGYKEIA